MRELITEQVFLYFYLDIINKQEFNNERLLSHKKYTSKIETKFEYEIVEIARTGAIALSRGPVPAKDM